MLPSDFRLNDITLALTYRAEEYEDAERYYNGEVGEFFATAQLRNVLRHTKHRGQHNYVRLVTDAVLNRLEIANIIADTQKAQKIIDAAWEENELDLEVPEVHRGALKYGDYYALAWPDEDGDIQISYSNPLNATIVYDPENPRKKQYGVKVWKERHPFDLTMKSTRLNVYTEDKIYKYISFSEGLALGMSWQLIGTEDNPFGVIPMFHFRTRRPYGVPEGKEAFGPQNDINKLLATHMFTVDYQGAPQRYALAYNGVDDIVDFDDDGTDRENIAALKSNPGEMWYLKGVTQVGELKPADPNIFWNPIERLKQAIASLTDTPLHYMDANVRITNGEALRTTEAPLLKKVKARQASFGTTWKELFNFVLVIENVNADVEVKWEAVESMDSLDEWDVMLKKINAGLSHRQALREAGYSDTEIEQIMTERDEEAANGQMYQRAPVVRVSTKNNETLPLEAEDVGQTEADRKEDLNEGA